MDKATTAPFTGHVKDGQLYLDDVPGYGRLLAALEGHDIELWIAKRRKQRSLSQNAFFHAVCLPMIAEAAGYDRSELQAVKDGLKLMFLSIPCEPGALQLVRGTSDLDTAEFTQFIEDCRRWAAETLHIAIPDPR